MSDLNRDMYRALGDIRSMRRAMAETTEFRGYGPATLTATGLIAVAAALVQARCVADPLRHILAYLTVWTAAAVAAATLAAAQMYTRTQRLHSGLSQEMLRLAVLQFVPALVAGMLLTAVLLRSVPGVAWMLPGLWMTIFSLGIFASCRFLPRPMVAAGAWYLLTGLSTLAMGGAGALAPWVMGAAFGAGQLLVAAVLMWGGAREAGDGD